MMILNQEIQLIIKSEEETREITCFEHDKLSKIREKCNIKGFLTHNSIVLDERKSIKENGLKFYDIIDVKPNFKHIAFKKTYGCNNALNLSDDLPIGLAIIYYIIKCEDPIYLLLLLNNKNKLNDIIFIYNTIQLNVKDVTPLRTFFINNNNPLVVVHITKNITC